MKRSILPVETLTNWITNNGVTLNGIAVSISPSGHGTGLVATAEANETGTVFIDVPSDLLLNQNKVWTLAESDPDLKAMLEANSDIAKTIRGCILIFLLMQITHSSPDILNSGYEKLPIGSPNVFSEYIQYIQTEKSLPLFWSEEDVAHAWGTSLERHHTAKMRFLQGEFKRLKNNCKSLPWADVWLGENGCLSFEDWLTVDAMWRSRAMDLSTANGGSDEHSYCLVPIMDMANHIPEGIAAYKLATHSNGSLSAQLTLDSTHVLFQDPGTKRTMQFNQDRHVLSGDEVTISYGSTKGSAEMVFSYGFLDQDLDDARSMMLGWALPEDDPLRFEKVASLDLEPGIQIYTPVSGSKEMRFVGAAVWAMSINEEDGLKIIAEEDEPAEKGEQQQDEGDDYRIPQFKMFFKDTLITSKSHLIDVLDHDRASLVFRTRAYAYVYMRIEEELERISELASSHEPKKDETDPSSTSSPRSQMCSALRAQEYVLLQMASSYYEKELTTLTQHQDVIDYPILLEQGKSLPPLSESERWNRYEDENSEENRRVYDEMLKCERLSLIDAQRLNGKDKTQCSETSNAGCVIGLWDDDLAEPQPDQEVIGWQIIPDHIEDEDEDQRFDFDMNGTTEYAEAGTNRRDWNVMSVTYNHSECDEEDQASNFEEDDIIQEPTTPQSYRDREIGWSQSLMKNRIDEDGESDATGCTIIG